MTSPIRFIRTYNGNVKLSANVYVSQDGSPCEPVTVYCPLENWLFARRVGTNAQAYMNRERVWVNPHNATIIY